MGQSPDREVLRELVRFMKGAHYLRTARFPALRRPVWLLPLEFQTVLEYLRGRTSPFTPTALPTLYGRAWFRNNQLTRLLYDLFYLNRPVPVTEAGSRIGKDLLEKLHGTGMLATTDDMTRSVFRLVPWGDSVFLSDPDQGNERTTVRYVYVGGDSVVLADFVRRTMLHREYERGLDLCAGTAFQGHSIRNRCGEVLAAEYNPRAVDFARATLYANEVPDTFSVVKSDLWENVEGTYDLIVSNPPYYPASEELRNTRILDVFGGEDHGMEKPMTIFDGFGHYLRHGGRGAILAASPVCGGDDIFPDRLEPLARKHGLETVLYPWKYTNMRLDPSYQVKHDIDHLIHYIVHAVRSGSGGVRVAGYPVLKKLIERSQIALQKKMPSWPGKQE